MRIETPNKNSTAPRSRAPLRFRLVPLALWVLAAFVLIGFPLRILRYGYLPDDDALRHAAKAVSGKSWGEILVLRPDITIDHNPGWHWLLTLVHHLSGWGPHGLVLFSVFALFVLFAAAPLPWLKRPETWLASLAVMMLVFPYFADRLLLGRPLLLSMAATLAILCLWTKHPEAKRSGARLAGTIVLFALSAWVHGSWYLLALIPTAFLLAGAWPKALGLAACWAAGTFVGAALTGHPFTFLYQSGMIPFLAFSVKSQSLVTEFEPFAGSYPALIVIGTVLIWRKLAGRPSEGLIRDPVLWLALVGWALGFRVARFWLDWGMPPLALWLARQFDELTTARSPTASWTRAAVAALAGAILLLGVADDRNARWSRYGKFECLDANRPGLAGWLPDRGGILYSVDLSVFYHTFYCNPRADWRYAMGFEPSFMLPENLAVYQELCRTLDAVRACAPWVRRMTPADRLVLRGPPRTKPAIAALEWHYAGDMLWLGRTPRTPLPGPTPNLNLTPTP